MMEQTTMIKDFVPQMPTNIDEWQSYVLKLSVLNNNVQFLIGDALLFGEEKDYLERGKYDKVAEATGIATKTLQQYVWICRKYSTNERKTSLGFEAHKLAVKLPPVEREDVLTQAEQDKLTTREIKQLVKQASGTETAPKEQKLVIEGPESSADDLFMDEDTHLTISDPSAIKIEDTDHFTMADLPSEPLDVTDTATTAEQHMKLWLEEATDMRANGQDLIDFVDWAEQYMKENF